MAAIQKCATPNIRQGLRSGMIVVVVTLFLYFAPGGLAADPTESLPGLPIGAEAPSFELSDSEDQKHTLASLLKGHEAVALVFHRSAEW